LALTAPAERAAAAAAAALGPEVSVGAPENGYVGLLTVSPKHAPAGAPVTLVAEGLPPGQEFQLAWSTAIGAWNVSDTDIMAANSRQWPTRSPRRGLMRPGG
jgi:hypothetical protein